MPGWNKKLRRDLQSRIEALGVERRLASEIAGMCRAEIEHRCRDVLAALVRALATPAELRQMQEAHREKAKP